MNTVESTDDRLWSVEDVAYYLGVPIATLYAWRGNSYGPPARRVGRHLRYVPDEVRSWVASLNASAAA